MCFNNAVHDVSLLSMKPLHELNKLGATDVSLGI